ncbi:MAG: indolepyruvate oxidoreductase subunit beta [Anaerolineaceae bacterium]|nr:indolepyruvate oxidoreductase subunit beta [Anaerolineaceae bacterium]
MRTKNILLTGVGGQGTILASKLLTLGLMSQGLDVKMSEVHGMSQREGPVLTHVRFGEKVYSPVVEKGKGDIMIGFEELEVLRNLDYLRDDGEGIVVLNTVKVNPIGVQAGTDKYPQNVEALIRKKTKHLIVVDATAKAKNLGSPKVMNIILLGAIIKYMQLQDINWEKIIEENVKKAFVDINKKALRLGMEL